MKKTTELAALPKSAQKVARQFGAGMVRRTKENLSVMQLINTGLGFGSTLGAAYVDHKFREGAEVEARIGAPDAKFRPQVNTAVAIVATGAGVFGRKLLGKHAGTAIAIGMGFGCPALYNFTRRKLADG